MSVLRSSISASRLLSPVVAMALFGFTASQAHAEGFNTGYILDEMPEKERIVHIDGVVRGIAFTHFFQNNKDETGFNCVSNYALTGSDTNWTDMIEFLAKYPDKPLGGVMFIYLRKKCGL